MLVSTILMHFEYFLVAKHMNHVVRKWPRNNFSNENCSRQETQCNEKVLSESNPNISVYTPTLIRLGYTLDRKNSFDI